MKGLPTIAEPGALKALGLTPTEEGIYRMLLSDDGATATDIASRLRQSLRTCQRVLVLLEGKGLVTHSPEKTRRYSAVPPDIAADVLIARRQSELQEARAAMTALRDAADGEHKNAAEGRVVEILNRQTATRMYMQLVRTAQREILCMERLPRLVSSDDTPDESLLQCLARGVRCRSITDNQVLNLPGSLNRLRASTAAGEQFRISRSLPFKLVVIDRRVALIPLHLAKPDGAVLLVRCSSLLDALCEMFEMYWSTAAPFVAELGGTAAAGPPDADNAHYDALLALLASGLNDKSIEHELGISQRTLARRVVKLMNRLGASTRFQAGWLAAVLAMHKQEPSAPGVHAVREWRGGSFLPLP